METTTTPFFSHLQLLSQLSILSRISNEREGEVSVFICACMYFFGRKNNRKSVHEDDSLGQLKGNVKFTRLVNNTAVPAAA